MMMDRVATTTQTIKATSRIDRWPRASRGSVLLVILPVVAVALSGCDIPDRHNIAVFRKPAAWEAEPSVPTTDATTTLSSLIDHSEVAPRDDSPSQSWFLHSIDRQIVQRIEQEPVAAVVEVSPSTTNLLSEVDSIVGGTRAFSETIDSEQRDENDPFPAVKRFHLQESVLAEPVASPGRFEPDSDFSDNRYRCLTQTDQTMWHAADGRVKRIESVVRRGPLETRKTIVISDGEIRFTCDDVGGPREKLIVHQGPVCGPWMVFESLRQNPIRRDGKRTSTVILPNQEVLAKLMLSGQPDALARQWVGEKVTQRRLHEAIATLSSDDPKQPLGAFPRDRLYWFDDAGEVLSTQVPDEEKFTYRCDSAEFEKFASRFWEQSHPVVVEIPGKSIPPGVIRQLAINVQLSKLPASLEKWPASVRVTTAPRQYSQTLGSTRQRLITSQKPVPAAKLAGRFDAFPTESRPEEMTADLAANRIIDFKSAAVRRVLGVTVSLDRMTGSEKANELNRTVHALLSFQSLSRGIRPASDIATTLLADSTEHSILLMAMLRANGIPSRIALGLQHSPASGLAGGTVTDGIEAGSTSGDANRFVYHAWVIAGVENEWISLDPTTGQDTAADCLAILIDSLDSNDAERLIDRYLARLQSVRMSVDAAVIE